MKLDQIAPHLVGRMLPSLLTDLLPRAERFPGDPWAAQAPHSSWYWMHSTGCPGGLYRSIRNEEFWQRVEEADPGQPRIIPGGHRLRWPRGTPGPAASPAVAATAHPAQIDLFTEETTT